MKKINAIIYTNNFRTVLNNAGFTKRGAEKNARNFAQMWLNNDSNLKGEKLVCIILRKANGELVATINA